jgi:predicted metal-dependent phosphoesterase TrpH
MQNITVELHSHTCYSKDSLILPEQLLKVCEQRGIDRIAITDHNSTEGAVQAAALDPESVIIGEEIMTTRGELLAYFVEEWVPPDLTPMETIHILRDQGAFISVSHPYDAIRSGSWREADLLEILPWVDAIEVYNARTLTDRPNRKAQRAASEANLLQTAGSDAHAYSEVGTTVMRLSPFKDPESMRHALRGAEIIARRSSPFVHLFSRYASLRKTLGWRMPDR